MIPRQVDAAVDTDSETRPRGATPRRVVNLPLLGLRWGWRELHRARVAIALLIVLASLSIIGTLLPLLPAEPRSVMNYVLNHPSTGPIFARLGLFDVFGSWFFILTALLMYLSLAAYLSVRVPTVWRRWRSGTGSRRFWADVCSVVFHAAFIPLLIGVVYGKAAGFVGNAAIIEGGSFVEAIANYDNLSQGPLAAPHQAYQLKIDKFRVQYYSSGLPKDFLSRVEVFDAGRQVMTKDIRVNHFLGYRGDQIYQVGYGWAPWVQIALPTGTAVADSPTVFLGDQRISNGVVKAPSAGPPSQQLGMTGYLIPDPRLSGQAISPGPAEWRNPVLIASLWRGDLHLDKAQNVYSLDTTGMQLVWRGLLRIGDSVTTDDGYRLSFPSLGRYTDLKVNHDPGQGIVYGSFVLGLAALILNMYLPMIGRRSQREVQLTDLELTPDVRPP